MPRTKNYNENEVIEKAMNLFWKNGYETTSMQMLEKEMGINKFSIYASFGNKNGVFLESIKCYKLKLNMLISKLEASTNGINGIKTYFYDFITFSKEKDCSKGCLITNTANEIGDDADEQIKNALSAFTNSVRSVFVKILAQESNYANAEQQADYLIVAMFGLSSASRVFNETQLNNYIENIFKNL
ncbi:TetR/AcrR family transcriptional regulator [Tamlana sp. 62-3]|uniref:TetR/AcrR family transcriptional regulator n=1 Tax=Neotamlana sargassicola TaxID=2883125 RepID=A0A9X1I745_9FLAO|nr:TetR/AcrR family transcriptional regulator [Tamlana sargassicola]MCB4807406.1 TetR/AcrR family transcriptional regulator [Tamlana sargassicola]